MSGNVCPKCGKAVMPYSRFIREAEPYKVSACGSCAAMLRRSRTVYLLLLGMIGILCLVGVPLFLELKKSGVAFWIDLIIFIVLLAGWILLTNYLGWRLIGWISVEEDNRR